MNYTNKESKDDARKRPVFYSETCSKCGRNSSVHHDDYKLENIGKLNGWQNQSIRNPILRTVYKCITYEYCSPDILGYTWICVLCNPPSKNLSSKREAQHATPDTCHCLS